MTVKSVKTGNSTSLAVGNTTAAIPDAPTIGAVAAGTIADRQVTVAFTNAPKGAAGTTFTATSTPSSITGSSATSPIAVSGLAAETSYTFTVKASNANGDSPASSASSSITTSAPGSVRAIFAGGYNASEISVNTMDYITMETTGNATSFGTLTVARFQPAGCGSSTRGLFGSGGNPSTGGNYSNVIDYVTIMSAGNATDFGDLTVSAYGMAACSSDIRGVWAAGYDNTRQNTIGYVTIASTGNATDFGDLTVGRSGPAGCGSSTRGIFAGGNNGSTINVIDYITIASTGNATDFGDLTSGGNNCGAASNSTRAIIVLGDSGSYTNNIDYVTIATTGNATDFGSLSVNRAQCPAVASSLRVCFAGGNAEAGGMSNVIDYVTIASTGNATDFGDLTTSRGGANPSGVSNGHGGL